MPIFFTIDTKNTPTQQPFQTLIFYDIEYLALRYRPASAFTTKLCLILLFMSFISTLFLYVKSHTFVKAHCFQ